MTVRWGQVKPITCLDSPLMRSIKHGISGDQSHHLTLYLLMTCVLASAQSDAHDAHGRPT